MTCACKKNNWVRFTSPNDNWPHCVAEHHPDCPESDWREYTKLSCSDGGSFICEPKDAADIINDQIDGDVGYQSEIVRMPRDVFEKLPEFDGF